jgi:RND family efflux transporter MFP subunit
MFSTMSLHMLLSRSALAMALTAALTSALAATSNTIAAQSPATGIGEANLDAVVEAVRQATLSSQVPGAIVALHVQAGDSVRAGQALMQIDARAAQQQVVGSSAQLDAAQAAQRVTAKELERQKQLFQKQYISQGALDRAQAQWESAQAQVQAVQAQTQAAQTHTGFFVIQAPFSGVISEVPVTLGDMAMPGRPLLVMHDPSALRISAAVPQALLDGLAARLKAVRYEVQGQAGVADGANPIRAQAPQVQLLPTVDASTHTAQLRITLPASLRGVTPGMFARVWVPTDRQVQGGSSPLVFVPTQTIVQRGEMTGAYVLDAQGQPRLRQVRLGPVQGHLVEVLSGVRPGEKVVNDPTHLAPHR